MKSKLLLAVLMLSAIKTYSQQLLPFDKIRVANMARVILVQGDTATVINEENSSPASSGYYNVTNDGWLIIEGNLEEEYIVTSPRLSKIEISGTGKLENSNFKAEDIELIVTGVGKMEMNLQATNIKTVISGAGKIELAGSANEMIIEISGAGKIDAEQFKVKRCIANITGSGKCIVDVSDELTSNISGSGSIYYVKPPAKINNNITGVGKVSDVNISSKDTTKISFGKRKILIVDGDGKSVRVGFKDTVKTDSDKKVKSHWAGFELGINTLVDKDFSSDLPPGYDFLEQREEKSIAVNFNVIDYQIKIYQRYVMLVSGLGLSYNNYRFRSDSYLAPNAGQVIAIVDSGLDLKKNKLVASYINVPLLIEFNTSHNPKKTFHIAAGIIGGIRIGSHLKLVKETGNSESKNKIYDDFNLNPFRYDATVRLGYRNFTIFGSYGLAGLFKDKKGPDINPFTVGLKLIGW